MFNLVRVSDFLHQVKHPVSINPESEYSLVTVKLHHKGVVLREKKKGSLIGSRMYRISEGQFILSGIDARNGAFGIVPKELDGAIVTNDFWVLDIDEKIIKLGYFYWLTNTPLFLDACIKASRGETQRIRLQKNLFFNHEIQIPSIEHQESYLKRITSTYQSLRKLNNELDVQIQYSSSLRQAILQEAIEGKLTTEWRREHMALISGDNHASKLLEKIKSEKERLIKNGELKKEKPLPSIRDEEKPFELPEGWVWCRLGEITNYGHTEKAKDIKDNTWVLDLEDIEKETSRLLQRVVYKDRTSLSAKNIFYKDYVLYGKLRPYLDKVIVAQEDGVATTELVPIRCYKGIDPSYLRVALKSKYFIEYAMSKVSGMKMPRLRTRDAQLALIPFAPFAEQQVIVKQVDKLVAYIDELEKQVSERKELSEMLMQSVLREAFALN